jgi:hypothetical protein
MADAPQRSTPRSRASSRQNPITVRPPRTAPLRDEDREQAVTALAALIAEWWERQHPTPPPAQRTRSRTSSPVEPDPG